MVNVYPKPYMLYRREDQIPQWRDNERLRRRSDSEYFKGLYPQSMRQSQRLVEEWCDRFDRPGSPMYDDYPDREMVYGMRDGILRSAGEQGIEADRDIVQVLLLQEMIRRRER